MRMYGDFKNYNKCFVSGDSSIGITIDGIGFTLNKDLVSYEGVDLCKDSDIYLDFSEADYYDEGFIRGFRLKSASIMIDGESFDVSDNSYIIYKILKNSNLTEIVTYGYNLDKLSKLQMLGSLVCYVGDKGLHFKTNKVCII